MQALQSKKSHTGRIAARTMHTHSYLTDTGAASRFTRKRSRAEREPAARGHAGRDRSAVRHVWVGPHNAARVLQRREDLRSRRAVSV